MVRIIPTQVDTSEGDENLERGNWNKQQDFLLSCLGYVVGLGNIWRFPHLSYINGGGAFFIPWILMTVFVGMPIFLLEIAIGQFSSCGPVTAYKFCPLLSGVGWGMVTVSGLVCIYYNVVLAWSFYYLFASFQRILPWASCQHEWNTPMCSDNWQKADCNSTGQYKYDNGTCYRSHAGNGTYRLSEIWDAEKAEESVIRPILPAEEYFYHKVLSASSGIDVIGKMNWGLFGCFSLAWITAFLMIFRGVKSTGKIVYFTSLFPYVILLILFVNGLTLRGAGNGIKFFVTPTWSRLTDSRVWSSAASQVFFSLSICLGGLMTMASYNRFQHNILRDTIIVSIANSGTSLFAGFVIYCYIGHLAETLGVSVRQVTAGGTGLTFIIIPAALTTLPFPPLWSVLFFVMLLLLGIDSQFTMVETITTTLLDVRPKWRPKRSFVTLCCLTILFLPGSLMCTEGGIHIFELMDEYCAGYNVIILCLLLLLSKTILYGYSRFSNDYKLMMGKRPSLWWRFCWQLAGPAVLIFVLVMGIIGINKNKTPAWSVLLGWLLSASVLIWTPCVAICKLYRSPEPSLKEKFKSAATPDHLYGPAILKFRDLVDYIPGFVVDLTNAPATPKRMLNEKYYEEESDNKKLEEPQSQSYDATVLLNPVTTVPSSNSIDTRENLPGVLNNNTKTNIKS